jgi:hypothetical protein
MADFPVKDYWKIYLNEDAKQRVREIQDHLEENYESRSDFLRDKLKQEKAMDIDERISRAEQEMKQYQDKLERLKQIKREREQQDKLRDKRDLLKQKQQKLQEYSGKTQMSKEDIRNQVEQELREKFDEADRVDDVEEKMQEEYTQRKINARVESRHEESVNVDQLIEDVQRLQRQVADLNGGEEDYFMDLENDKEEVKAI